MSGRERIRGLYREYKAGEFSRYDSTIQFLNRANALAQDTRVVVDLGAGRGGLANSSSKYVRNLADLRVEGRRVIGVDVDDAVLVNPLLDEAIVYDGRHIPLADASVDLVVSDWVFEHVADVPSFSGELTRIVKPGGWLCARTPNAISLLALASRSIPNSSHLTILHRAQPDRQTRDVFPTCYKLNTRKSIEAAFRPHLWSNHSYTWSPEPGYDFGSPWFHRVLSAYQYIKYPLLGGEVIIALLQRTEA